MQQRLACFDDLIILRHDRDLPAAVCDPPCQNDGHCVQPGHCACSPGWLGERCEHGELPLVYICLLKLYMPGNVV